MQPLGNSADLSEKVSPASTIQNAAGSNMPATLPASSAAPAVADLPEQFGRYRILKKLGQGGMGAVYLAHDSQLDRRVALKVPRFPIDDLEAVERFRREAQAAAALHHAHLCPVYDVGQIDGAHFLTMAYIEGQSLAESIRSGPPRSARECAVLVRQLALALEVAHGHGIIHRDLKPANILLNAAGEPVITDFELARRLTQTGERLTASGAILGTPAYMSPEQVEGRTEEIGAAADIYGLGVILYELLTGTIPFRGSMASVLAQIVSAEPELPSRLRPDLDSRLEAMVMKALSRNASDRYGSMGEFATALAAYLDSDNRPVTPSNRLAPIRTSEAARTPVGAVAATLSPSPLSTMPAASRSRRRWVVVALGLLAVVAVLSGIIYIRIHDSDGKGKKPAEVSPATSAAPATQKEAEQGKPLGTGKFQKGLVIDVIELKPTSDTFMRVSYRIRNPTSEPIAISITGVLFTPAMYYVEEGGQFKVGVVKQGTVFLASDIGGTIKLGPGESKEYWAKFGRPHDGIKHLTFYFEHAEPIEDVPVPADMKSGGQEAKPAEGARGTLRVRN